MKKENPLANKMAENVSWECIANHLPKWSDDLRIETLMEAKKDNRVSDLVDRYNDLSEREKKAGTDAHSIYGVETEKTEIIDEVMKILERYKAVVKSGPKPISIFLFPDSIEKQDLWLDGYNYACEVFSDLAEPHRKL